jgi:hypothetical protein
VHEFLGKGPVVGHQQKPLALTVETADMEEVAAVGGKKVKDRALCMPIPTGGGVARELVQQEGSWRYRADAPPMDPDIILWKDPA